ncbi:MAG: SDR family NAD(P)-dependent oxidoreductase [Bacteroidales bacterium]|jgi:short-subunit dehydrogenase|nr:SDR family NAD(P)-dependent oxidoreductase [Bacteroidales bacterium]
MKYNTKVFWVTGASSGIGEAMVYELLDRGARVIASSNNADELNEVKKRCEARKHVLHTSVFDLADMGNIENIVAEQVEKHGHIDVLINLGGISQRATIIETPLWLDRKIMEINYFGTIALSKAVLPYMIRERSGHILATSSISGRFGFPLRSAYSASKQALHGFFETLHIEHRTDNVKASVIIPGRVRTNISYRALTASGKEHGRMDAGQAGGISPEKAVKVILKGLEKNKREIPVGGKELFMLYIRKYFPSIFFNIAGKIKAH